ncbi:hypothetical protein BDQ94DRAFT_164695 [Aspergillus welwitschiae]|uniref:Uncharacterized protein n=1 Tax=Aspergillus welwitschiae TaxID=1341132 RepID=A0A3F3PIL7_9EURO|nr:hypothetical protein BDQ94DRAFT_164695 [Aspergillus welwitschiae]RDH26186.1 hypothetical protein BDQ94DRAFT_164695 [Aspergillus welwitschiae]
MQQFGWGFDPIVHPAWCIYEAKELLKGDENTRCQDHNQILPPSMHSSQPQDTFYAPKKGLRLTEESVCSSCLECDREQEQFWGFDGAVEALIHRTD